MKIYENGINWVIEDYLDLEFTNHIESMDLNKFHQGLIDFNFFDKFDRHGLIFFKEAEK